MVEPLLAPVEAITGADPAGLAAQAGFAPGRTTGASFSKLLLDGVDHVNRKQIEADAVVQAFALDDTVPIHQVTYALEQARLSLELMMQVRSRLVEGYQEIMRMQL